MATLAIALLTLCVSEIETLDRELNTSYLIYDTVILLTPLRSFATDTTVVAVTTTAASTAVALLPQIMSK